MDTLTITDSNNNSIKLVGLEIIQMELKLNNSIHSRTYSHIGDYLYDFYIKINYLDQQPNILVVKNDEMINLKLLC